MENDELKKEEKNEVNNTEVNSNANNIVNNEVKEDANNNTDNGESKELENNIENNADAIAEIKEEYKELDDRFKRMLAEFENFKKRTQKEKENIYGMVTGDVLMTMLPIMDNLEKAAEAKTEDSQYQEGIKLVSRQFSEALKSLGLEEIEAVGKRFDPQYHEAVSHIEDETKGEQEIVQEYRKGYKIGNKVIRYSMVIVAN